MVRNWFLGHQRLRSLVDQARACRWTKGYDGFFCSILSLSAEPVQGRAYAGALGWYKLFVGGFDLTGSALVPR